MPQRATEMANVRFLFHHGECHRHQSVQVSDQKSEAFSKGYKLCTKQAQSSASENTAPERTNLVISHSGQCSAPPA
jgi:hypothetical protein